MIYSISMMNSKWVENEPPIYKLSAVICTAENEFEARGYAQEWNERKYYQDDGWVLCKIIVLPIPTETDMNINLTGIIPEFEDLNADL